MNTAARWISIVAHPFVMAALLVLVPALRRTSAANAMQSFLLIAAGVLVPIGILMIRQVRRGQWENVDASNASERPVLYGVALAGLGAIAAWLYIRDPRSYLVRGVLVVAAFLFVAAILTHWIKLSLHMAFAALTATALSLLHSPVGYALIAVIPALAWSRVAMSRHRPIELAIGLALGAITGYVLVR